MMKILPAVYKTWVQSLGWEDPLEKEMATHSSILAWKIPWMEKPGRLQSMGSQGVGHTWVTSLPLFPLQKDSDFPGGSVVKNLPERQVRSLSWEVPHNEGMATYSSILARRIPWTEANGDYSPCGRKEWDTTEWLNFHYFHIPNWDWRRIRTTYAQWKPQTWCVFIVKALIPNT